MSPLEKKFPPFVKHNVAGSQWLNFGGACRSRMIHQHLWGHTNQTVPTNFTSSQLSNETIALGDPVFNLPWFYWTLSPPPHAPPAVPSVFIGACSLFSPIILGAVHGQVSCKSSHNRPNLRDAPIHRLWPFWNKLWRFPRGYPAVSKQPQSVLYKPFVCCWTCVNIKNWARNGFTLFIKMLFQNDETPCYFQ